MTMMTSNDTPQARASLDREALTLTRQQAIGTRGERVTRIDEIVRDIHTAIEYGQVSERFANAVVRIRV